MKTVILVTNLGATCMIRKQKPSHLNGRVWDLWGEKRNTKFGARWKWCWQFCLITEVSFTMSTHQIVKLLTRNTMSKLSVGCIMRCGATTCIMESKWLADAPSQCSALSSQLAQNFLAKHQIPQMPQPPYSLDIAPCDFFLFPKVLSRGAQVMHIAAANIFWFLSFISPFLHHLFSMLPRNCATSDCQWDNFHIWRVAANMLIRNC